eukprot:TRINITY_DN12716_c0_g1_i1.p1 TRINITY_DN12716_c0_g1~~TRINITY_DN12716_c0_g1_i1.p1  ORF type:complete len:124 (+),score=15.79 TRINITY_DN12716_c0_g1_i1:116-487(+)
MTTVLSPNMFSCTPSFWGAEHRQTKRKMDEMESEDIIHNNTKRAKINIINKQPIVSLPREPSLAIVLYEPSINQSKTQDLVYNAVVRYQQSEIQKEQQKLVDQQMLRYMFGQNKCAVGMDVDE